MNELINQESLYFMYEEGYQKNKNNVKEFIQFMLDNSIESSQFLLKCNIILESLTQSSPRSRDIIETSMKKVFKIFENTKKNIKNEIKKALHLIISFLKSTYFEESKKMNLQSYLDFLSKEWKESLDNEYRVTTNRREKLYDLVNILEADYNTQKNSKIEPNFYRESTVAKSGFFAQSMSKYTGYTKQEEKLAGHGKENDNKTNLLHMDTSRDKIQVNFLRTNRGSSDVSDFLLPNSEYSKQIGSKISKGDTDVFMIDEYEEIFYQDNMKRKSPNIDNIIPEKPPKESYRSSYRYSRDREGESIKETSESILKSYDTEDLRMIRASKFRTNPTQKSKKEIAEDYMVIDQASSIDITTPESQETQPKHFETPSHFESEKLAQRKNNMDPEIYYVNYKKSSKKRNRKRSSKRKRGSSSSRKDQKTKRSNSKRRSLCMETMKPLQVVVLKEDSIIQEETSGISDTENSRVHENSQSLLNLNESSIRSMNKRGGIPPKNEIIDKRVISRNGNKILPDNINESLMRAEEEIRGSQKLQKSDLHEKLNNIQMDFHKKAVHSEIKSNYNERVLIQKQQVVSRNVLLQEHQQGNIPNLMGTYDTNLNSHTVQSTNSKTQKLNNIQNIENTFNTLESFKNKDNALSSVKKLYSPLVQSKTEPFSIPSESKVQENLNSLNHPLSQNIQHFNPNLGNSSQITHSNLVRTLATNSLTNSEMKHSGLNQNQNSNSNSKLEQSERFFANDSFGYPHNHAFNSMLHQSPVKNPQLVSSSQKMSNKKTTPKSLKNQNSPLQRPFGSPNSNFVGFKDLSKVNDPDIVNSGTGKRAFGDLSEEVVYKKNEYVLKDTKQFFAKFIVEEHNLETRKFLFFILY